MINLDIETCILDQVRTRRFRWSLSAPAEPTLVSPESFATRREAEAAGKVALLRAVERGRIHQKASHADSRPHLAGLGQDLEVPMLATHAAPGRTAQ